MSNVSQARATQDHPILSPIPDTPNQCNRREIAHAQTGPKAFSKRDLSHSLDNVSCVDGGPTYGAVERPVEISRRSK